MFFDLTGKVAVITGGASGIGLSVARRFHGAGASVVIADLQDGEDLATEINGRYLCLDVSDGEAVRGAMETVDTEIGKIDILVNNAGINGADGMYIEHCDDALTRKLFEVNTLGVYFGLKYGPRHMNDGGSIINTASLAASYVFPGSGPYSASKLGNKRITAKLVECSAVRFDVFGEATEGVSHFPFLYRHPLQISEQSLEPCQSPQTTRHFGFLYFQPDL